VAARAGDIFRSSVLPALIEYIRIPCKSPAYAPTWEADGHMAQAFELARAWVADRPIPGLRVEVIQLPGRTPVLLAEVPATSGAEATGPTLLYGHLDKQPELFGWRDGLGPWTPVLDGDRLYGRGSGDDGYAVFAALTAIEAVVAGGGSHGPCVVLIEGSEESGSPDLPAYVDALADRLGTPALVVCLDSGCPTYDRLWITTSLRGLAGGALTVEVLTAGVHSGAAGGVVPDSFRLLRHLLSRVEDPATGRILLPELHADVPAERQRQIAEAAAEVGSSSSGVWPWVDGGGPAPGEPAALLRAKTWEPSLAVTGLEGAPPLAEAGNVIRPSTSAKLSFRLPPSCDPDRAQAAIAAAFAADLPTGSHVRFEPDATAAGWDAPPVAQWLAHAAEAASQAAWGAGARYIGEGGSIPFMHMLGERFPNAQFVITGVLGPESNAHGPN
jgi:acetylornithine deacetylase/succinyl-diaminopimelate desuccinylase-like protein